MIRPPQSRIDPLSQQERETVRNRSPLKGRYEQTLDRESAHEVLFKRTEEEQRMQAAQKAEKEYQRERKQSSRSRPRARRQGIGEAMLKSAARSIGSSVGRLIIRGIMGSLLGGH